MNCLYGVASSNTLSIERSDGEKSMSGTLGMPNRDGLGLRVCRKKEDDEHQGYALLLTWKAHENSHCSPALPRQPHRECS
jgi:hypothetical protein